MQTYTHFLLAVALRKPLSRVADRLNLPPLRLSALLTGSVLPDLPLILTTLVCMAIDKYRGIPLPSPDSPPSASVTMQLFREWFFENPWVIAEHNLFHGPLCVALLLAVAWWLWRRGSEQAGWFIWLFISCLLHTAVDIPVHHDDGPLLLFPFNWDIRYISPISYWDPAHHGRGFAIVEHIVALFLFVFALRSVTSWLQRRFKSVRDTPLR
jgi:membrane-bound metal-dependent hydrolase YbcI (DUF457 family)